jgi:hypothetical protein
MTILVIGIATNKLFALDLAPDDRAQPYLVDVAAELMSSDGKPTDLIKRTVRLPKDTSVQVGAQDVHKISTRTARRAGATQKWAVYGLVELINEARYAVSYSDMTRRVISSIIMRVAGNDAEQWLANWDRAGVEWVDLRVPATQICKRPYDPPNALGGFRWPTRVEAADSLLGPEAVAALATDGALMNSAAWLNLKTDRAIFLALRSRGLIEAGEPAHEVAA